MKKSSTDLEISTAISKEENGGEQALIYQTCQDQHFIKGTKEMNFTSLPRVVHP